jgi:hypothetical protein
MDTQTEDQRRQEQGLPPIGVAMLTPSLRTGAATPVSPQPIQPPANGPAMAVPPPNSVPAGPAPAIAPAYTPGSTISSATGQNAPPPMPTPAKSATAQLWDKAGQVQNPFERILARVGSGILRGADLGAEALLPAQAMTIPGSERFTEAANRNATNRAMQERALEQKPELAGLAGEEKGRLEAQREEAQAKTTADEIASKEKIAGEGNQTKEQIAGEGNQTKTAIAGEDNATKEKIAGQNNLTRTQVAQRANETRRMIAQEHEAGANSRAALTNDPDKLTNTMKTMKQQAQATLPQIDKAIDETNQVADLLGPAAGRWNDFIQGKVGAPDPRFAHYADEIHMVSTAVTLAHARGRMSNELYESFQKMFDAGKQSPENMIQALDVAKEWLGGYASIGEKGSPVGGEGGTPPTGAKIIKLDDFLKGK